MSSTELIGLIEGVAPVLANALGGPLAGAAIQVLASALGQAEPDIIKVTEAAKTSDPTALKTAAERAEAAFVQALTSAAPPSSQPSTVHDRAEKIITDAGVTNPTAVMAGSFVITVLTGWLANKGWASSDLTLTLLSALIFAISSGGSIYWSWASNSNTKSLIGK